MTAKAAFLEVYVLACELQGQLRGRRKKYLKRAWRIAHHLPPWPDGVSKGTALAMVVLLLLSAARVRKAAVRGRGS